MLLFYLLPANSYTAILATGYRKWRFYLLYSERYRPVEGTIKRVHCYKYLAPLLTLGPVVPCSCSTLRRGLQGFGV